MSVSGSELFIQKCSKSLSKFCFSQDFNRRRNTRQSASNNDSPRNPPPKPLISQSKPPLKNPVKEIDMEMEKVLLRLLFQVK